MSEQKAENGTAGGQSELSGLVMCNYCDGTGEIETSNNGPIGPCPVCHHKRIAEKLYQLSAAMLEVGTEMEYYGGFSAIGNHGREMIGASKITFDWANGVAGA